MESFALLDDRDGASRLYTGHCGSLLCPTPEAFADSLVALQAALRQGRYGVAVLGYELGAALQDIDPREPELLRASAVSQILLFTDCVKLSQDEVHRWLSGQDTAATDGDTSHTTPAGICAVQANVDRASFDAAIARIHEWIAAGDTYQINYTYRLRFSAFGGVHALYARLRARQPVPYGALIGLPDGVAVLSLSPELFVRHTHGTLTARPMKGTAAASGDPVRDAGSARALANDPKNRAENVMIVDLLRNDLGRIAHTGSVQVPDLFEVSRFSQVLQMTSTVQAQLRDSVDLPELMAALFPCGSITGAPKRRTMELIRGLEPDARGYYTGALGWFDAPTDDQRIGDFCLSVPIRTLTLQAPDAVGVRAGEMGVGAGIVHDSVAQEEYAECALKARFLTGLGQTFSLFETMYATRADGCRHVERHCQRLASSAAFYGFPYAEATVRAELASACASLPPETACRLRLALDSQGGLEIQSVPLLPLNEPVSLFIAPQSTQAGDHFLRHKTTHRQHYDAAWRAAEAAGGFDQLFFNERGELTEGGRCSVFLLLDGRWVTPPLACGVLPGVMRAVLLADPAWNAVEQVVSRTDLQRAERVVVCNALRGVLEGSMGSDSIDL